MPYSVLQRESEIIYRDFLFEMVLRIMITFIFDNHKVNGEKKFNISNLIFILGFLWVKEG